MYMQNLTNLADTRETMFMPAVALIECRFSKYAPVHVTGSLT